MTSFNTAGLGNAWPLQALETVCACPYCGGGSKTLAHQDVQDWSFGCAAGRWNYWSCDHCRALYLDPRPTADSIGDAYGRYYTHAPAQGTGWTGRLKQRLKNEYWSHRFHASFAPRLALPGWTAPFFKMLKPWVTEPFGLRQMAQLPKGLLIDVGCGNGNTLMLARQLGWQTLGIELDPSAVAFAQSQGLNVVQGSYEALAAYPVQADCIVCSHVLEHVHQPLALLKLLLAALKPAGVLLLSAPNASSYLRDFYGENWRGLEAPRHLALPDAQWLVHWLQAQGFDCQQIASMDTVMMTESERIRRRSLTPLPADAKAAKTAFRTALRTPGLARQDIVQIVCTRASA